MRIVVGLMITLLLFGYPILLYVDSVISYNCFQPVAFFGTFFTLLSLKIPFILFLRLLNPFDALDDIDCEALIAATEMCSFQCLRSQWCDNLTVQQSKNNTDLVAKGEMENIEFYATEGWVSDGSMVESDYSA